MGVVKTIKDGVDGLNPVEAEHETVYDIEPISGTTMNVRSRIQMSLRTQKTQTWYRDILEPHCDTYLDSSCALYLPVYWTQTEGYITPEAATNFRSKIYFELSKKKKLPILAFFSGAVMIFASFWLMVLSFRQRFAVAPQQTKKRRIRKNAHKKNNRTRIAATPKPAKDQYKS